MDAIPAPSPVHNCPKCAADDIFIFVVFGILPDLILVLIMAAVVIKVCRDNFRVRITDLESAQTLPTNNQRLPQPDEQRIKQIATGCTECAICLGEYGSDQNGVVRRTLKPCGHRFHKACIDGWLEKERQCPICRCVSSGESSVSVHGKQSPA